MNAAHTKGPWVFEPHGAFRSKIGDRDWPVGYISRGHDKPIFELDDATCWHGKAMPTKELIANAHLIAAAPALLEALDFMVNVSRSTPGFSAMAREQAERALSLAKGESA